MDHETRIFLVVHVLATLVVFALGRLLFRRIGSNSERRRLHGAYVLSWSIAGYFVGGLIAARTAEPEYLMSETGPGMAGFGLFVALLLGNVHGGVVLLVRWRRKHSTIG